MTQVESEQVVQSLESALPAVASRAAVQLDNLRLGRSQTLEAVARLADILHAMRASREESKYIDPSQAIVVNRAIRDASILPEFLSTLDQIVEEAGKLRDRLTRITQSPEVLESDTTELEALINFCVALSKQAASLERPPEEMKPGHPFRR